MTWSYINFEGLDHQHEMKKKKGCTMYEISMAAVTRYRHVRLNTA